MEKIKEYAYRLVLFLKEVKQETKKVTWPQRKEIVSSTILVIASVFVLAFFLGLVDWTLQELLRKIIK